MDGVTTTAAEIEAHNRQFLEEALGDWAKRAAAEIDAEVMRLFYGNAGCA
jgi:hypothetical protein